MVRQPQIDGLNELGNANAAVAHGLGRRRDNIVLQVRWCRDGLPRPDSQRFRNRHTVSVAEVL